MKRGKDISSKKKNFFKDNNWKGFLLAFILLVLIVVLIYVFLIQKSSTGNVISSSNIILNYSFDKNDVEDDSVRGNDGALIGNPSFSDNGVYGNSLIFDGVDDSLATNVGGFNALNGALSFWIKPYEATALMTSTQIVYNDVAPYRFMIYFSGNKLFFKNDGYSCDQFLVQTSSLNWKANEFHHVMILWNNKATSLLGTNKGAIFVDGKLVSTVIKNALCGRGQSSIQTIGGYGAYRFKGEIDEVKIYNTAVFSQADITELSRTQCNVYYSASGVYYRANSWEYLYANQWGYSSPDKRIICLGTRWYESGPNKEFPFTTGVIAPCTLFANRVYTTTAEGILEKGTTLPQVCQTGSVACYSDDNCPIGQRCNSENTCEISPSSSNCRKVDFNCNGVVNEGDIEVITKLLTKRNEIGKTPVYTGECPAFSLFLSKNPQISFNLFTQTKAQIQSCIETTQSCLKIDFNCNGIYEKEDSAILVNFFASTAGNPPLISSFIDTITCPTYKKYLQEMMGRGVTKISMNEIVSFYSLTDLCLDRTCFSESFKESQCIAIVEAGTGTKCVNNKCILKVWDVTLGSIAVPSNGGDTFSVPIKNEGTENIDSVGGEIYIDGVLFKRFSVVNLVAGGQELLTYSTPLVQTSGYHRIDVSVDHSNILFETYETNNKISVSFCQSSCILEKLRVPVLVINYLPVSLTDPTKLDANVDGEGSTVIAKRTKINNLVNYAADYLEKASIYHGYKDSSAQPFLDYEIRDTIEFTNPIPWDYYGTPRDASVAPNVNCGDVTDKVTGRIKHVCHPDYRRILGQDEFFDVSNLKEKTGNDLCYYVDIMGVREIWMFSYHISYVRDASSQGGFRVVRTQGTCTIDTDCPTNYFCTGNKKCREIVTHELGPVESDMSVGRASKIYWNHGTYGDYSNSAQSNDLPQCEHSYILYNYNYNTNLGEMIEDHTHQMEALFSGIDNNNIFRPLFVGFPNGPREFYRCGWTHYPPNVMKYSNYDGGNSGGHDYDWGNSEQELSDCEDWNPQGIGTKKLVSRITWDLYNSCATLVNNQCVGGDVNYNINTGFKMWWMQNMPGKNNRLTFEGKSLRNWWEFKGDFDKAVLQGNSLVA